MLSPANIAMSVYQLTQRRKGGMTSTMNLVRAILPCDTKEVRGVEQSGDHSSCLAVDLYPCPLRASERLFVGASAWSLRSRQPGL